MMKTELRMAFEAEMTAAAQLVRAERLDCAMRRLETAHVLGQRHVVPHVRAHWWMLRIELRRRAVSDGCGQAIRIVIGALGSAIGVVPIGNTGGSDVNMFARMPVDPGLAALIERDRAVR